MEGPEDKPFTTAIRGAPASLSSVVDRLCRAGEAITELGSLIAMEIIKPASPSPSVEAKWQVGARGSQLS